VLLARASLGLMIGTAVCLVIHASVAVILALPLLALICLSVAIRLSPATRYEAAVPGDWRTVEYGLRELDRYANQASLR
jgi:hypothetical protein